MGGQSRWGLFQGDFLAVSGGEGAERRVCGYNRKYAIRKLSGPPPGQKRELAGRRRRPLYGSRVISVLREVWEVAGYPWSVRLTAMLPVWLPWIRKRFLLTPETQKQLLSISPQQIDRRLQERKLKLKRRLYGPHILPTFRKAV